MLQRIWLASSLLCALGIAISCDSTTPDEIGPPARLVVVAGDDQAGGVGQELTNPIVAKITDARDRPVPNAVVSFVVTSGGGSVSAPAAQANAQGIVQNRWTLGTSTALAQRVEVRAVNPNTGQPQTLGVFRAHAVSDYVHSLEKAGGEGQPGIAGTALPESLSVRVRDKYGNPVRGAVVSWNVTAGGGAVSPAVSLTDMAGIVKTRWTMGTTAGLNSVSASVAELASVTFSVVSSPATSAP